VTFRIRKPAHKEIPIFRIWIFFLFFAFTLFIPGCSFDYGAGQGSSENRPDIIMENISYVRVRKGDLLARFYAVEAERWEDRQIMILRDFTFEQMEDKGETVSIEGRAGTAEIQVDSGDIHFYNGVRFDIESEDFILRTLEIEWKDKEKALLGNPDEDVYIERSDGTSFSGKGLSADIRSRTWEFSGVVSGIFVEEDEKDSGEDSEE